MNNKIVTALDRGSTLFLKLILLGLSTGVLVVCGFLIYQITQLDSFGYYLPVLIIVVISTIPLQYIFYQAFRLLVNIDKNLSLTQSSVSSLRIIKVCSFLISLMYLIGSPLIINAAEQDDAPGVVLINLIFIIGSFSVGVFGYILQKLLINAIRYKSENDLTV